MSGCWWSPPLGNVALRGKQWEYGPMFYDPCALGLRVVEFWWKLAGDGDLGVRYGRLKALQTLKNSSTLSFHPPVVPMWNAWKEIKSCIICWNICLRIRHLFARYNELYFHVILTYLSCKFYVVFIDRKNNVKPLDAAIVEEGELHVFRLRASCLEW